MKTTLLRWKSKVPFLFLGFSFLVFFGIFFDGIFKEVHAEVRTHAKSSGIESVGATKATYKPTKGVQMSLPIQVIENPYGVKVWLVSESSIPVVALNIAFPGGASQDGEQGGLATLAANALGEGTKSLSSQDFKKKLDTLGASMGCSASRDYVTCSLASLAKNKQEVFSLFQEMLHQPRFDQADIARLQAQQISDIQSLEENPGSLAFKELLHAVGGDSPYTRVVVGTKASVESLTPESVKNYVQKTFVQQGAFMTIVGPIDQEEAKKLVTLLFADFPATSHWDTIADVIPKAGVTKTVSIPNPQTVVTFALAAPKPSSPDYIPMFVLNYVLGGGSFSSRLMEEIREKRGLAYYAYSSLLSDQHLNLLYGSVGTQKERAEESIRIIREQVEDIASHGITPQELQDAKDYLIGSYPLRFSSNAGISNVLMGLLVQGRDPSFVQERNAKIASVTLEDVKRVAHTYLHSKLSFGIAGILPTAEPAKQDKEESLPQHALPSKA